MRVTLSRCGALLVLLAGSLPAQSDPRSELAALRQEVEEIEGHIARRARSRTAAASS